MESRKREDDFLGRGCWFVGLGSLGRKVMLEIGVEDEDVDQLCNREKGGR